MACFRLLRKDFFNITPHIRLKSWKKSPGINGFLVMGWGPLLAKPALDALESNYAVLKFTHFGGSNNTNLHFMVILRDLPLFLVHWFGLVKQKDPCSRFHERFVRSVSREWIFFGQILRWKFGGSTDRYKNRAFFLSFIR